MKTFVTIVKAVVTRALFATHAFIAVWKLVDLKGGRTAYWYMVAPLMLQGFEGIVSVCARNGEEMKWFCPSVFLYLVSVVPPIWLMELGLNDLRVNSTHEIRNSSSNMYSEIGGLKLDLALPIEQWVRVLEQVLLVILLVGRWLLPKGKLTREQLSQLLLAYMAMAADIIELFECFKEDAVTRNVELIYATMGIWSWSLMQFTLVLSSTYARKPRPSINYPPPHEVSELLSHCPSDQASTATCAYISLYLDMDIIAILTTVFMQDGPFFLLRMTLIFGYKVVSYLNIFFTCKNTLVVSLQLYRLFVLCSRKRSINKRRRELDRRLRRKSSAFSTSNDQQQDRSSQGEATPPAPTPPPQDTQPDHDTLEQSLLEVIESLGGENVLKELESLVRVPQEEEEGRPGASLTSVREEEVGLGGAGVDRFRRCPPMPPSSRDQGQQLSRSSQPYIRRSVKRHYSVSRRNEEYLKRLGRLPECYNVSDGATLSDTDAANDNLSLEQRGMSESSTSLFEAQVKAPRHGWGVVRDRCLPHAAGVWGSGGLSRPASFPRQPLQRVATLPTPASVTLPHQQISHSLQQELGRPDAGADARSTGEVLAVPPPRCRHSDLYDQLPHKCNGVVEVDQDSLETSV